MYITFLGVIMSETQLLELSALTELSRELTAIDCIRIRNAIGLPEGLSEEAKEGFLFLIAFKQWRGHRPHRFYTILRDIHPELITIACKIPWLCVTSHSDVEYEEEEKINIKSLIDLLKTEITKGQWVAIYMVVAGETNVNIGFQETLEMLLEKGLIYSDLTQLSQIMEVIQRNDIVEKLRVFQRAFSRMEEGEFESKFKREVNNQAKEMAKWEKKLKKFLFIQHGTVQEMLGEDQMVNLKKVYIDLTILKQKPRPINLKDETTYNEIAYLRKIANKQVEIKPIDFTKELRKYKARKSITYKTKYPEVGKWKSYKQKPEIWCLIGNPGCGKTFLAKRTALRFSSNELTGIQYSISVPCRNTDWHAMESTRYEEEKKVESEFIQKWLCLGLPVASNWSNDLAKHLHKTDGEGLLLIIDGLDEFTKKVPFKDTFLCLLLTRQSLIKSTIILTSRPGAWTDVSSSHELKIDRYYQVLGFSPENRDLYFKKQITNEHKLKACWELMERHDEMKQLSLIPVNASLFAALLKGDESTSINTLTKLYNELTLYMIRRELSRMGLQELARVGRISYLHEDILDCLYKIGFIAFLGVANRDLASEENVPLIMGQEEYACQCLGLAHEHYRKESIGLIKKVWTFVHLTMQEFVSALWLEHTTWTEQCYSVRYISKSMSNFSLFRMVVRFLCGLVSDKAAAVLSIIYRYLTPQPIQLIDMPMCYQLKYDDLYHHQGWNEFTEIYFQLSAIVYETNSNSVPFWYSNFQQYFPDPIYLYIQSAISPNEWICFIQSLKLVNKIQLIRIDTRNINTTQFNYLMLELRNCSVSLLALKFYEKDSNTVLSYTEIIRNTEMKFDTKICFELSRCNLSDETGVRIFQTTNQILSGLRLYRNEYSNKVIKELTNQMSAIQYLYVWEFETNSDTLVPALCQATQLRLLYLYDIPEEHLPTLQAVLPQFSELQEIAFDNNSLLPAISNLSNVTYLQIQDYTTEDTTLSVYLLHIINGNRHSLRGILLLYLNRIGFNNWCLFLNCMEFCTNLVQLKLWFTTPPANDVTYWSRALNKLISLVELEFQHVSLYDPGLLSLCEGLIYHPTIRSLKLKGDSNLTSLSCDPLIHLIPTVSQMETLTVAGLSEPDGAPILLLKQTADEFSIEHYLS